MNIKFSFIILLMLLSTGCRNRNKTIVREETARVKVARVTTREMSIPVHSTGILSSSDELKLSFKTGGIISSIKVNEGEKVRKGQLLASLNPAEIDAAVNQARNAYEKALRDYKRAENLYRDSVATLELRQNAETALDVAKSTLSVAQFNLQHSSIVAPVNGIILKKLAKENELIASGYPVFLFGSEGKYWKVKTGLPDKDVIRISRGDSAVVRFDAYPSVKFRATVDQVGEMANPYTGTYDIELLVDGTGYRLASGFIAAADISPSDRHIFTMVPVGSIVGANGREGYVYVVNDSSIARKIKISIESIPGDIAAVKGIPEGTPEVISEGAAYLRDGMKVTVVR